MNSSNQSHISNFKLFSKQMSYDLRELAELFTKVSAVEDLRSVWTNIKYIRMYNKHTCASLGLREGG